MGKRYVIGDIHGRLEALKEVLALAKFDYEKDKLILLGDVVDGGYDTRKVVDELLKIKNRVFIIGNHDAWAMNFLSSGWAGEVWLSQGGANTLRSYGSEYKQPARPSRTDYDLRLDLRGVNVPTPHQDFFNHGVYYHIEPVHPHECAQGKDRIRAFSVDVTGNVECSHCKQKVGRGLMLFVHGGFDARHRKSVFDASPEILTWDRDLIEYAREGNTIPGWEWVFVGHTTTQTYDSMEPLRFSNLLMLDCGAGWTGRLALMDIDTKEYWLSDVQTPAVKR